MTWHYAPMQGSVHPTFDPLAGLRAAAAARDAAGLRRYLVPRAADDGPLTETTSARRRAHWPLRAIAAIIAGIPHKREGTPHDRVSDAG
jgi:hypothetical protein